MNVQRMKKQMEKRNMQRYDQKSHTFVVCAYQESPYLEECIRSLQNQTLETTVCIATSTPNEYITGIAKKYQLPVFINSGEKGIAGDWNFACDCADTPLITLAHQDDVYCENYTKYIIESLNKCSRPLIAFTDYYELRNNKTVEKNVLLGVKRILLTPMKMRCLWKNKFVRRRIMSVGSAICCPTVTLVKDNLKFPLFKNNMKSNIDWQAWEEISRFDGEFAYVPHPVVKHRIHEQSTTSELLEIDGRKEEDLYMFRKFWPGWMANVIDFFYKTNERFNRL